MHRLPSLLAVLGFAALFCSTASLAQTAAVPDAVVLDTGTLDQPKMAELPVSGSVTSIALSEDNRYLALAMDNANRVEIFDARKATRLAQIETPSPRAILFRAGKLLAANYGRGTISIFDPARQWQQIVALPTGHKNVHHLAAPQGPYFRGQILACCEADPEKFPDELKPERPNPRQNGMQVITLVDPKTLTARDVHYNTGIDLHAVCSYVGGHVVVHSQEGEDRWIRDTYDYESLVAGYRKTRPPGYAASGRYWPTNQVAEGHFWFGPRRVDKGIPTQWTYDQPTLSLPNLAYDAYNNLHLIVPDRNGELFYAKVKEPSEVYTCSMKCCRLGDPNHPIASWTVEESALSRGLAQDTIAFTADGVVYVYLHTDHYEEAGLRKGVTHFELPAPTIPETPAGEPGTFDLERESPFLTYSYDGQSILWLDDNVLRVLNAAGTALVRSLTLPRCYKQLFERERYYVAISATSVDFLDKQSGKPYRQVPLDQMEATRLALHPGRPVAYIAATRQPPQAVCRSKVILQMDELKGTFEELPGIYGNWVAADPAGRYLAAVIRDSIHPDGPPLDWEHTRPYDYKGSVNILATFDIRGPKPSPLQVNTFGGSNGAQLAVAPDGNAFAYVGISTAGCTGTLYDAPDVEKAACKIQAEKCHPCASFHPVLDMIVFAGSPPRFFSRSGEPQEVSVEGKLPEGTNALRYVFFAPDGRHLLVGYRDPQRGHLLKSFPLILSPEQIARVGNGFQPAKVVAPTVATVAAAPIAADSLGALQPIPESAPTLTGDQLAAEFRRSVVIIRIPGKMNATGMVIDTDGTILTSADVITPMGRPTVVYTTQTGETTEAETEVLRTDPETNLAILKINPASPLPTIRFDRLAPVTPNQRIYVLECRQPILYSREDKQEIDSSTGLVYNPRLELSGKTFLQTSANIGGQSSGAPVFNTRGGVIGVITTNKDVFGASAMAVPLDKVLAFLQTK
ncbi:MAG TPA: serine protease [Thermoguttaceae bacterium]|nr:serine protease [Thermoguttaceae bacterium]